MHSTRPLQQLEERVRNHLKLVSNTILAIMRPGCLILTATILRSSIKASRRGSRQRRNHHSGMDRDRQRTRPSHPRPARPACLRLKLPAVFSSFPTFQRSNTPVCLSLTGHRWRNSQDLWIGLPQPAIVRLASEGGFAGAVLDAGCGTGENALHVASLGLSVLGVDVAETALAIAREKADDRGIEVEFVAADVFQLERLGRRFSTVLDCGLFHSFDGDERPGYVASLASVTEPDGTLYVLCFSDDGPDTGPHPISQEELRAAFNPSNGWNVAAIEPDRIQTRYHDDGARAWFATIKRI